MGGFRYGVLIAGCISQWKLSGEIRDRQKAQISSWLQASAVLRIRKFEALGHDFPYS